MPPIQRSVPKDRGRRGPATAQSTTDQPTRTSTPHWLNDFMAREGVIGDPPRGTSLPPAGDRRTETAQAGTRLPPERRTATAAKSYRPQSHLGRIAVALGAVLLVGGTVAYVQYGGSSRMPHLQAKPAPLALAPLEPAQTAQSSRLSVPAAIRAAVVASPRLKPSPSQKRSIDRSLAKTAPVPGERGADAFNFPLQPIPAPPTYMSDWAQSLEIALPKNKAMTIAAAAKPAAPSSALPSAPAAKLPAPQPKTQIAALALPLPPAPAPAATPPRPFDAPDLAAHQPPGPTPSAVALQSAAKPAVPSLALPAAPAAELPAPRRATQVAAVAPPPPAPAPATIPRPFGATDLAAHQPPGPVPSAIVQQSVKPPMAPIARTPSLAAGLPSGTSLHLRVIYTPSGPQEAPRIAALTAQLSGAVNGIATTEASVGPVEAEAVAYFFPDDRASAMAVASSLAAVTKRAEPVKLLHGVPLPRPGTVDILLPLKSGKDLTNENS
jgi:hypothetical protein